MYNTAKLSILPAVKQIIKVICLPPFLPSFFPSISFSQLSIDGDPKYLPLGRHVKDMKGNKFKVCKDISYFASASRYYDHPNHFWVWD